jgi:putative ABC transport system permease protein
VPQASVLVEARVASGGEYRLILIGLDDASLVGVPRAFVAGSAEGLAAPDAVIIDEATYRRFWPGEPLCTGRLLELNDQRAIVQGVFRSRPTFQVYPIAYTRYSSTTTFVPAMRRQITYILAKSDEDMAAEDVCCRIEERTGLMALTRKHFMWRTMRHYLRTTGVILNFALTVFLGFLVGISMAGVSFHLFTAENLSQFGVLEAIGLTGRRLVGMVLAQALLVGAIGYGIGVGLAALFGKLISSSSLLAFYMPCEVMLGSGLALMVIVSLVSLISIHHVLRLEPAVVLRK